MAIGTPIGGVRHFRQTAWTVRWATVGKDRPGMVIGRHSGREDVADRTMASARDQTGDRTQVRPDRSGRDASRYSGGSV